MASNVIVKMDDRCPRKLKTLPCSFCPLAVSRLKAVTYNTAKDDEFDETQLPGCDYAIDSQMANYCFFKYVSELLPVEQQLSDMRISFLLKVPLSQIKGIEQEAIKKLAKHEIFQELKEQGVDIFDIISNQKSSNINITNK